jgi:hypothetical protein
MSPSRCLSLLAALLVSACESPRKVAMARLRRSNTAELRTDVARLHTQFLQSPDQDYLPLKSSWWTESVRKLKPLRVGLYRDGLSVALREEPGFEFGLHIVPQSVTRPPNPSPYIRYEQLEDGIYWYTLER